MADARKRIPHEPDDGAAAANDPVEGSPLDDLLWELDVTTVRQVEPSTPLAPAPAALLPENSHTDADGPDADGSDLDGSGSAPSDARGAAGAESRSQPSTSSYRELRPPFQRFTDSLAVRVVFGILLVGGTAGIVALALTR